MNQRKHLTLIAAGSAFLASLPLINVFDEYTWAIRSFLVVAAMCGVGLLVRSLRAPTWAPTAAMGLAGLFALTWLYPSKQEFIGILPSPGTIKHFGTLLTTASTEMSEYATPVADRPGFLFLATLGVALVAIIVDLFAVVLRRPALAGLPMLAIYSVPVTVTPESTSWLPFALGAIGFLWLLVTDNVDRVRRFGRRFTGDGRDIDLWEPSPLAAAGQRLGAISVVAAVVLPLIPFAFPAGVLDQLGSGAGGGGGGMGGSGKSGKVSMFALLSGQLNRDKSYDMVKVTNLNDPKPDYLRFNVLEDLTRNGFQAKPIVGGQPLNNGFGNAPWAASVKAPTYKANIEVTKELSIYFLPIYAYPTGVDKVDKNTWSFDRNTTVVYSSKQTTAGRKYTVEYSRPEFTAEALRAAAPLKDDDPAVRGMTAAPANPVVKELVASLTKDKTTQYDKVMAILKHFSIENGFVYDKTTGAETNNSKILDFLQNKRGYCAQYSAAFGWLLREAKIPSRVAFGFANGGPRNGQTMTLSNFNLHAWTEVYFPGFGWLPFDATPPSSILGAINPSYIPNAAATTPEDEDLPRGGPQTGPSSSADPNVVPDAGNNPGNTDTGAGTDTETPLWRVVVFTGGPWILGAGLLVGLLVAPALTRGKTRRTRLRSAAAGPPPPGPGTSAEPGRMTLIPDERDLEAARFEAHHAWDELVDTMVDYHVPIDEAETPRATVARLVTKERLQDQAQTGVQLLSTVEEHARYARTPVTSAQLRGSLDAVRSAFAARASRKVRFLAVVFPPSVLRRWRSSSAQRSSSTALWLGERWESMMRAVSVRRFVARRTDR